jgi:hypothetical protein
MSENRSPYVSLFLDSQQKEDAICAILEERDFQDAKWGTPQRTGGHTLGEWAILLEFELNEFKQALVKGGEGRDSAHSELIQIAAVALSALEQHGVVNSNEGRKI